MKKLRFALFVCLMVLALAACGAGGGGAAGEGKFVGIAMPTNLRNDGWRTVQHGEGI